MHRARLLEQFFEAAKTLDGHNVIEHVDANGIPQRRTIQGLGIDEPLVGQRQPKIFYYEADGLAPGE
jgi:hypothetical protein